MASRKRKAERDERRANNELGAQLQAEGGLDEEAPEGKRGRVLRGEGGVADAPVNLARRRSYPPRQLMPDELWVIADHRKPPPPEEDDFPPEFALFAEPGDTDCFLIGEGVDGLTCTFLSGADLRARGYFEWTSAEQQAFWAKWARGI